MSVAFTSCQDDDFDSDYTISNYSDDLESNLRNDRSSCFELVFPVTIELSDGTQLSVADREELKTAAHEDIETNGREVGRPDLVFPVDITVDGETQTVADQEAFREIKELCKDLEGEGRDGRGKGGKKKGGKEKGDRGNKGLKCFSISYPVTIIFEDGTSQTIDSRAAGKEAFAAYKEVNPEASERPELQFPVNITLADGTSQDVATEEEFDLLKDSCEGAFGEGRGDRDKGERCFALVYPVTFGFTDGSTVSVDSREDRRSAIQEFKEANPGIAERPSLQFPITVSFEDETTQSIASQEELEVLADTCDDNN